MPPTKQKTTTVTCPKCGHEQPEPLGAYSTNCKKCRAHFRLDEAPAKQPATAKPKKAAFEQRKITCFQCGTELEVPVAAESTMCKRCSSHVDLRDYEITQTVSKNFRTYGRLLLEEKGYILNTDSRVGEAIIKGRFIGKITADRFLEIHTTARIKGSFNTGRLVIPAGNHFRWPEPLRIGGADIAGELVANLATTGTVVLRATARLFGDVEAANFVVESGAVFVGAVRSGPTSPVVATAVEVSKTVPVRDLPAKRARTPRR
jgi:cytoskeletal protein CcmA (bactofilin family)/DNA-directed RNA polymerase subunit RPC12/RpoP